MLVSLIYCVVNETDYCMICQTFTRRCSNSSTVFIFYCNQQNYSAMSYGKLHPDSKYAKNIPIGLQMPKLWANDCAHEIFLLRV